MAHPEFDSNDQYVEPKERQSSPLDLMFKDHPANLKRRIAELEAALQYVDDCFNAALAEGWIDALANNDRDLIEDIWRRRISYAWSNTLNVLQDSSAPERTKAETPLSIEQPHQSKIPTQPQGEGS